MIAYPTGSSPRLWGTPLRRPPCMFGIRFIPTAVGNAPALPTSSSPPSVHPHGCGERNGTGKVTINANGSSPRLWGTPALGAWGDGGKRFIPTAVGNAVPVFALVIACSVHPHGCGERFITVCK